MGRIRKLVLYFYTHARIITHKSLFFFFPFIAGSSDYLRTGEDIWERRQILRGFFFKKKKMFDGSKRKK